MNNINLAIILATYNGEKYLKEQLDSVLNQTYDEFTLYIRDDNSTDNTKNIINEYISKFPNKIIEIKDNKISRGACNNFLLALEYVYNLNKHNIFMFCDQDDVWSNNKIEITLNEYEKYEHKNKPILLFTDAYVADKELNIINKSFIKYSNLRSDYINFNNYLIQNNALGCTICVNKELVYLIKFDIKNIVMHDWYFTLLASALGQVIFINKTTIYYRQHDNNIYGAKKLGLFDKLKIIKQDYINLFTQAESFKNIYYNSLTDKNKNIIDKFFKIKNSSKIEKFRIIKKYKIYKQGFKRILAHNNYCKLTLKF